MSNHRDAETPSGKVQPGPIPTSAEGLEREPQTEDIRGNGAYDNPSPNQHDAVQGASLSGAELEISATKDDDAMGAGA